MLIISRESMLALKEKTLVEAEKLFFFFFCLDDVRSERKNVFPFSGSHLCF